MATILFSTVGQAVGGPLGAAVGAAVGGSLDAALLAPRRPGLADLQILRSSYGDPLPRLYGQTRVAGILLWARPMLPGGSKGGGRRAYSMSLAVALSARPIRSIGRIWADGREIRDAQGRFETPTAMRLHDGSGTGEVDPLIAAAEGAEAPGYRALAYVVFESLALGPFGNRIPSFGFEVFADDSPASDWLADLAAPAAVSAGTADLGLGYAAAGRRGDDLAFLARAADAEPSYRAGLPAFDAAAPVVAIPSGALLAGADGDAPAAARALALAARPAGLAIGYLDPERDYLAGRQRVDRGRPGPTISAEAPLTASAGTARRLAARWLRREEGSRETLRLRLDWAWLGIEVGQLIQLDAAGPLWRVVRRDVIGLEVALEAELAPGGGVPDALVTADAGRALPAPLVPAPPTRLAVIEPPVPLAGEGPALWIAGSGGPGWRGARLAIVPDGPDGAEMVPIGEVGAPLVWGVLGSALGAGTDTLWDEVARIDLSLAPGSERPVSRGAAAVLAGANLVAVGGELLQFRDAEEIGEGSWRLSGLLRGRFGTQPAGAAAGSPIVEVRVDALVRWPLAPDMVARTVAVLAIGPGDPAGGTEQLHSVTGAGLGPLGPRHVRVRRAADSSILAEAVPRWPASYPWTASVPSPEGYVWTFRAAGGGVWSWRTLAPRLELLPAIQQAATGGVLGPGEMLVAAEGEAPLALRASMPVTL